MFNMGNLRRDSEDGVGRGSYDPKQGVPLERRCNMSLPYQRVSKGITTRVCEQLTALSV